MLSVLTLPACLDTGNTTPETLLVSLEEVSASAGGETRQGLASAQGDSSHLQLLTEDFHTARTPSQAYDANRILFVGRREASQTDQVWEMKLDGSGLRSITRGEGAPSDPVYLPDNRILYSDRVPENAHPGSSARALYSCATDGSDIQRLTFGPHRDRRPRMLDDGRVSFERQLVDTGSQTRTLEMTIRPDGTGVSRFLTPETIVEDPGPTPAVEAPEGWKVLAAQRVSTKNPPPILTSVVNPERPTGTLLCLDAYASRLPEVANLPRGSIDRVRIEVSQEKPGDGHPAGGELRSAEAPVSEDGSFLIEVPADVPLRLTLLDEEGNTLGRLESGIWVRPNENRGCLGCHEEPDLAPVNRQPAAVTQAAVSLVEALAEREGDHAR